MGSRETLVGDAPVLTISSELPQGPQSESINHLIDRDHPFGAGYTADNLDFFAKVLPFLEPDYEPLTRKQRADRWKYSGLFKKLVEERNAERDGIILAEVESMGVTVKKTKTEGMQNIFILQSGEMPLYVNQANKQTIISFIQNPDVPFSTASIYDLMFEQIPLSFQENREAPLNPKDIKSKTSASIVFQGNGAKGYRLSSPREAEEFETVIRNRHSQISGVIMTSEVGGKSYSMTFQNMGNTSDKYFEFRFVSKNDLNPETMDILLGMHVDAKKMGDSLEEHATKLTAAVNLIKDFHRVPDPSR